MWDTHMRGRWGRASCLVLCGIHDRGSPADVGGVESIRWGLLAEKEEPHGCLGDICFQLFLGLLPLKWC